MWVLCRVTDDLWTPAVSEYTHALTYHAIACRQLHLFSYDYLVDTALPAYAQADNPTVLEFLSK